MNPILVEVMRGGTLESSHTGALAVVEAQGRVVASLGDLDRPIFARSAVKLLQALPLVESDAAERLQLDDAELALACASHSGEPHHLRVASSMLAKAGVDAGVLECGAHWPYLDTVSRDLAAQGQAPTPLHNNCSGKHAGFICLGSVLRGWNDDSMPLRDFIKGYVAQEHPVMREVTEALQASTGYDLGRAACGTDGCSIPAFAIPLRHLALAFARVATGVGLREGHVRAARRLRAAIAAAPAMVAGTGRFDTCVMQRLGQRVCCKAGAEGVYCAGFPERGVGVAIKIDDGGSRAAEIVMAGVIEGLLKLSDDDAAFMRGLSHVTLRNWNGIEVRALQAGDTLKRKLTQLQLQLSA